MAKMNGHLLVTLIEISCPQFQCMCKYLLNIIDILSFVELLGIANASNTVKRIYNSQGGAGGAAVTAVTAVTVLLYSCLPRIHNIQIGPKLINSFLLNIVRFDAFILV